MIFLSHNQRFFNNRSITRFIKSNGNNDGVIVGTTQCAPCRPIYEEVARRLLYTVHNYYLVKAKTLHPADRECVRITYHNKTRRGYVNERKLDIRLRSRSSPDRGRRVPPQLRDRRSKCILPRAASYTPWRTTVSQGMRLGARPATTTTQQRPPANVQARIP